MKSRLRVIVIAATTIGVVSIAAGLATAGDSGVSAGRQATKVVCQCFDEVILGFLGALAKRFGANRLLFSLGDINGELDYLVGLP